MDAETITNRLDQLDACISTHVMLVYRREP